MLMDKLIYSAKKIGACVASLCALVGLVCGAAYSYMCAGAPACVCVIILGCLAVPTVTRFVRFLIS